LISFVSTNIVEDASAQMRVEANQPEKVEAAFHDIKLRCSVCKWLVDKIYKWVWKEKPEGEEALLDFFIDLCRAQDLSNSWTIYEDERGIFSFGKDPEGSKFKTDITWKTHAVEKLCEEIIYRHGVKLGKTMLLEDFVLDKKRKKRASKKLLCQELSKTCPIKNKSKEEL